METAALGKAWLWLLLFDAPLFRAVLLLAPQPCRQVALPPPSILQVCNGGLAGLGVCSAIHPLGWVGLQTKMPKCGQGALCTLGLVGQPFPGLANPVGTSSHAGGQQLWEEPNVGKICRGVLAALLGRLLWHALVMFYTHPKYIEKS